MNRQRGFTLLEVMVALAVFALLAAAAGSASAYVLGQQQALRDRLLAAWLVDNHLAELSLVGPTTQGNRQHRIGMDGRDWQLDELQGPVGRDGLVAVTLNVRLHGAVHPVYRSSTWRGASDGQP